MTHVLLNEQQRQGARMTNVPIFNGTASAVVTVQYGEWFDQPVLRPHADSQEKGNQYAKISR